MHSRAIPALLLTTVLTPVALAADLVPNGVDDTVAINTALATAHVATLGPGLFRACGINVGNAAFLRGLGNASVIQKTSTCASPLIMNSDLTAAGITLSDLTLNGKGLPGGLVSLANDGAFNHGSHNLHNVYLLNDAGDCLTMGYGTRDSILDHIRVYHCGGFGIKAVGADSQYNGVDVGSTGLAGFYADDSNPTIAGLKVWMAGYGTANQPGLQCYQCSGLTASAYFSQDNGGAAFAGVVADHIRVDVQSDSDNAAGQGQPAVSFNRVTNSVADIVLSHRTGGMGVVTTGYVGTLSTGDATSIVGVP